ncbi:MAG: hypothetical protein ACI8Y4_003578 [Candidatus Poriferisodalaceae bacterium]|jgi:hypothetical protein
MRAWRWPARLLIPTALVAGLVVDSTIDRSVTLDEADAVATEVAVSDQDALSSTWMCPTVNMQRSGGAGINAAGVIHITNTGDTPTRANVQLISPTDASVSVNIDLPALSTRSVDAAALLPSELVAALVESPSGGVSVARSFESEHGFDVANCSTVAADQWFVPAGDTLRDAVDTIVLFNPLPSAAIVDFAFATEAESGAFTVVDLEGVVVAARSVQLVDVGAHVRVRESVATSINVRSGRIVVDHLQTFDGTDGREGFSAALATAALSTRWTSAAGYVDADATMSVHIFNPTDEVAEVDVAALSGVAGSGDPVALSIGPRDSAVVPVSVFLDDRPLVPTLEVVGGLEFGIVVESANGVPIAVATEIGIRPVGSSLPPPATTTTTTTTTTAPATTAPPTTGPPAAEDSENGATSTSVAPTDTTNVPTTVPPTTVPPTTVPPTTVPPTTVPPTTVAPVTTVAEAPAPVRAERAAAGLSMRPADPAPASRWLMVSSPGPDTHDRVVLLNHGTESIHVVIRDLQGQVVTELDIESAELQVVEMSRGDAWFIDSNGPVAVSGDQHVVGGLGVGLVSGVLG